MKITMLEDGRDLDFKYVISDPDPRGNARIYFRPPGRPKRRMQTPPGSAEFAREYLDLFFEYAIWASEREMVEAVVTKIGATEASAKRMIVRYRRHGHIPQKVTIDELRAEFFVGEDA